MQKKYKGFLILQHENFYEIRRKDNQILASNIENTDACRFLVDLECIGEEYKQKLKTLNDREFYEINCIYISLMQKDSEQTLSEDEKVLYYWAEKIRNQKMKRR